MSLSISDLLNAIEVRGRTWCYLDMTDNAGFSVPPGAAILVYVVLRGSVTLASADGTTMAVQAGDAAFVTSGTAHALRTGPGAEPQQLPFLCDAQDVDAPPTLLVGRGETCPVRILAGRLRPTWPEGLNRARLPSVLVVSGDQRAVGEQPIAPARLAASGFGPGSSVMLTRLASVLLADAFRREFIGRREVAVAGTDPVGKAVEMIELQPGLNWDVNNLARSVGMGRSSFCALFTRQVGVPPMKFITDVRMRKARDLVRDSAMQLQDIGEALGYGCEKAFSRRFARHFGASPSAMRANTGRAGSSEGADVRSYSILSKRRRAAQAV
jgi:AraC-like DNA-binding protein